MPGLAVSKDINDIKALADSIETIIEEEHITGLMLGIIRSDSTLFSGGFGYTCRENQSPVDQQSLFRMGSITKMLISISIVQLANEGKLSLEDKLSEIASEVPCKNQWESSHPLRIIHLMEHSSGFDDVKLNRMYSQEKLEMSSREMMLFQSPSMVCRWKPGSRTSYSNPNYAILGYLIEKFSGKGFGEYIYENIFSPLSIENIHFNSGPDSNPAESCEYIFEDGRTKKIPGVFALIPPATSMWANSQDMLKLLHFFIEGDSSILSATQLKSLEIPISTQAAREGFTTGNSLLNYNTLIYQNYPFRGHHGLAGTFRSAFHYNRELRSGFVLSSNSNGPSDRIENLIAEFLTQDLEEYPISETRLDWEEINPFLGTYEFSSPRNQINAFSDKFLNLAELYEDNGKLFFKVLSGGSWELTQAKAQIFIVDGMNIPFVKLSRDSEGKPILYFGSNYFEKKNSLLAYSKRIIILLAVIILISHILVGLFTFIQFFRGKIKVQEFLGNFVSVFGILGLVFALYNLLDIQVFTYRLSELNEINSRTLSIFLGTSLFGVVCIYSIWQLFQRIKHRKRIVYSAILAISFIVVCLWLASSDWIGLRTWAL